MQLEEFITQLSINSNNFTNQQKKEIIQCLLGEGCILVPLANNEIKIISVEDIVYVKQPKYDKVIIQTIEDEIEFCNYAFNLFDFLLEKHSGIFKSANNSVLVNIETMKEYDSFFNKIFFKSGHEIVVTQATIKNIAQKYLGKHNDIYIDPLETKTRFRFYKFR